MPGFAARRPGQALRPGVRPPPRQPRPLQPGPGSQHPAAGVPDASDRSTRPEPPRRTSSSAFHRPPGDHRADPRVLATLRRPRPPGQRGPAVQFSLPLEAAACAALLHAADTVLTTPNLREALAPLVGSLATDT